MPQTLLTFGIQICLWLLLFLSPISNLMLVILFIIASDMFVGVWASLKRGDPFSSRALRRTVGKVFIYEFVLIFSHVLETFVFPGQPLVRGAMSFISVVEGLSVVENVKSITGLDIFNFIFHKINLPQDSKKFLFKLRKQTFKLNHEKSIDKKKKDSECLCVGVKGKAHCLCKQKISKSKNKSKT